jgi:hypothetical protein
MNGLRMTRDYRSLTYWFRASARFVSKFTFDPLESLGVKFGLIKSRQRTLVWTKKHTWDPPLPPAPTPQPPIARTGHHPSPSIELTDYSTRIHDESALQDTPAMAHSLFPPAITPRRPRNESDASFNEPSLPIYEQYRTSDDSNRPLIQRPSDVHRSRAAPTTSAHHTGDEDRFHAEGRRSSDFADRRSSSEHMLSPTSPADDHQPLGGWLGLNTIQSRQGYRRANSDPGSPPFAAGGAGEDALGISMDGGSGEGSSGAR